MANDVPVAPGDILLGKYRVERVLGKGGMGVVVGVRHVDLDEMFAIKMMLPGVIASQEGVERFLREARAAAKLKGEHVAKVFDVGRLPDGTPYMVMEYLTGSDLKQLVRQVGALPPADAVLFMQQACETLREAHALGIIHRDVKSANMFLTQRPNGTPCLKVLDFGISKSIAPDAVGLTTTGTVGGSPLYMSPEQMRSAKYVDHRTDIWAIGVVLYELLTGRTPFLADTITAVAGRVLQDEPELPSRSRPEVPGWLDAVVLRCLEKKPDQRYQSMVEVMEALRAPATAGPAAVVARGSVADPGADIPTLPLTSVVPMRPMATPMPVVAVTGAAGKTESTTAGLSRSSEAIPAAGPRGGASRARGGLVVGVTLVFGILAAAGAFLVFRPGAAPSAAVVDANPAPATAEAPATASVSGTVSAEVVPATPAPSETPVAIPTMAPEPLLLPSAKASATASVVPLTPSPTPKATTPTAPAKVPSPANTSVPHGATSPTATPTAPAKTPRSLL